MKTFILFLLFPAAALADVAAPTFTDLEGCRVQLSQSRLEVLQVRAQLAIDSANEILGPKKLKLTPNGTIVAEKPPTPPRPTPTPKPSPEPKAAPKK